MILLGIWFVLQFLPAVGQLSAPDVGGGGVAYFAHIGGFLFGMALVKLLVQRTPGRPPPPPSRRTDRRTSGRPFPEPSAGCMVALTT